MVNTIQTSLRESPSFPLLHTAIPGGRAVRGSYSP